MSFMRIALLAALASATALASAVAPPAAAAPTTVTYNVAGIEYAATFAQSSFAGAAVSSSKTEFGVWNAVVDHDIDGVTGGTFAFRSKVRTFDDTFTRGTFGPAAGTCAKRTFGVHAELSGGGSFDVTLTRYGSMSGGTCVVYLATVRGTASF